MSGLPSVLAGLFIYATLILPFAKQFTLFSFNGFMASLALALISCLRGTQGAAVAAIPAQGPDQHAGA